MAASLARVNSDQTVRVRVMNPFQHDAMIHSGTIMGEAQSFDKVMSLFDEDDTAIDDVSVARRMQMTPTDELVDNQEHCVRLLTDNASSSNLAIPSHLQTLYEKTAANIDDVYHKDVAALFNEFSDTFSRDENDLGCTNLTCHTIDTGDARPIKQAPRRTPAAFEGRDKEAIEKMLQRSTIRESSSSWASPVVLVPKKDGSLRVAVDYRKLNDVTKKDAFPLPKISDCLDAVSGAAYFSTLDLTSGFNQVPVAEQDIPKTAFATKYGLFESVYLPFGLSNAPATFQRVMELALQGLQWQICLIYIDDIIVFGGTMEEHLARVRSVLDRLRKANLKVKPEKCHFFESEVVFLGHIVSGDGVRPNPTNIDRILSWDTPRSTKQVRQFLGMATYYRRFIKDFAKIAEPLSKLTSKCVQFSWNSDCQEAFVTLKAALTGPDIMAYPLNDGIFILDTDACDTAIGSVLSQIQDGRERVVAYASRTLNKAERNYCVTDKELLAVKHFIEDFFQYLMGRHFVVRPDHQPLKWLFSLREPSGRIARWLQILSDYDFELEYSKGLKHNNADGMSRCPNPRTCQCNFDDGDESALKCGPCKKCLRRSEQMLSEWEAVREKLRVGRAAEGTDSDFQYDDHIKANKVYIESTPRANIHSTTSSRDNLMHVYHLACFMIFFISMVVSSGVQSVTSFILFVGIWYWSSYVEAVLVGAPMQCIRYWHVLHSWLAKIREPDSPVIIGDPEVEQDESCHGSSRHPDGGSKWLLAIFSLLLLISTAFFTVGFTVTVCLTILCILWFSAHLIKTSIVWSSEKIRVLRSESLDHVWCQGYSRAELIQHQLQDTVLSVVIGWLKSGKVPALESLCGKSPDLRHYWIYLNSLELKDELLCRKYYKQDGTGTYTQFVVPRSMRDEVLRMMHNCVLSGHLGRRKTTEKLLQRFYWFRVREDVKLWVTRCDICQSIKPPNKKAKAPLGKMGVGAPLDRLCTDILGPLPLTAKGNRYILVVTDSFSKWTEVFAIPDETAYTCANVILNEVICRYGCPLSLHTDQGRNFESNIFKELCKMLEIRKTRTTPRNPKCNGQTERYNKTLISMIKAYIKGEQNNWDENLGCLAGAYRATPHDSTTLTPNMLMLGREIRLPHEVVFGSSVSENKYDNVANYGEYVIDLKNKLQKAHDVTRLHLDKVAERQKEHYDLNVQFVSYKVGDLVWLLNEVRELGVCPKLQPAFTGPYVVSGKLGPATIELQLDQHGKKRVIHHDKLKRYTGVHPPKWTIGIINKLKSENVISHQ